MCIAETGDVPSLHIVHSLMTKYPHVPVRIFQGEIATYSTIVLLYPYMYVYGIPQGRPVLG